MTPTARSLASLAAALGFVAATRALEPAPGARAELQYAVVLTLGYGHLLGALRTRGVRVRTRALVALVLADLLCLYLLALPALPGLVPALFAVSTWHALENEHALARGAGPGVALPALARGARSHVLLAGLSVGVVAAALRPGLGGPGLPFSDVFTVATLHHLGSWLLHTLARAPRRALASHALAALALAPLLTLEAPWLAPLRAAALSPALYLFWSTLHVAQTAWRRGVERA